MILQAVFFTWLIHSNSFAYEDRFIYHVRLIHLGNETKLNHVRFEGRDASLAIDGNLKTCAHAGHNPDNDEFVWWSIKLDRFFDITHVRVSIDRKAEYLRMFDDIEIYVDASWRNKEEMCFSVTPIVLPDLDGFYQITCIEKLKGNIVKLSKREEWLILCEVQILADFREVNLAYKRPFTKNDSILTDGSGSLVDEDPLTCNNILANENVAVWWRVMLDSLYYITDVGFYWSWHHDGTYSIHIYISDISRNYEQRLCTSHYERREKIQDHAYTGFKCSKPTLGRYVTVNVFDSKKLFKALCEMKVYSKDFTPEMAETPSPSCLPSEYKCIDGGCISKIWLCDGTIDCPFDDDEAPSCRRDKSRFKCKRINETVSLQTRCDGVWNCPDYSDEEFCFEVKEKYITATFKGESDFYICSDDWKDKHGFTLFQEYNLIYQRSSFEPVFEGQKFIKINASKTLSNTSGFMALFQKSSCESKKFVSEILVITPERVHTCGVRGFSDALLEPYIIKGHKANPGAFPWMVKIHVIENYNVLPIEQMCSGVLIDHQWIITRGNCLGKHTNSYFQVTLGSPDGFDSNKVVVTLKIKNPDLNIKHDQLLHDLAMLRLESMQPDSKYIRSICLPETKLDKRTLLSYQFCVVAGFGFNDKESSFSIKLQYARMNILSNEECANHLDPKSIYSVKRLLDEGNFFCAGQMPLETGVNICGDSGSPLMCKGIDSIWTVVGIAYGDFNISTYFDMQSVCSHSIFIKVDRYLDFIHTVTDKYEITPTKTSPNAKATALFVRVYNNYFYVLPFIIMEFKKDD